MADVYTYLVPLPSGVREMVTPCADGDYTVYINDGISSDERMAAYDHAMKHINGEDFEKCDVQDIESDAHG